MATGEVSLMEVVWAIRDARSLSATEKAVAYAVASRGRCWASADVVAADAGIARSAFYRARAGLVERGVLVEERRVGSTTVYTVDLSAVLALVPDGVIKEQESPLSDSTGVSFPSSLDSLSFSSSLTPVQNEHTPPVQNEHTPLFKTNTPPCSKRTHKEEHKEELKEEIKEEQNITSDLHLTSEGTPVMKRTVDDVLKSASLLGFSGITEAEAASVVKLANGSALKGETVDILVKVYLQRRGLPSLDADYVKGVGFLSWMLKNPEAGAAWVPKPVSGPVDVRTAEHTKGGRSYGHFW